MNKKGFTLVELVATIALLAIIAIISFVSINAVLEDSRVKNCENLVKSIKVAAKEYVSDNRYDFDNNNTRTISVKTLIEGKYLTDEIKNPFNTSEDVTNKIEVSIQLNDDYSAKSITVNVDCNDKETFNK